MTIFDQWCPPRIPSIVFTLHQWQQFGWANGRDSLAGPQKALVYLEHRLDPNQNLISSYYANSTCNKGNGVIQHIYQTLFNVFLCCRMDENYSLLPHGVNFQDAIFADTQDNWRLFSSLFQYSNCSQGQQVMDELESQEDSRVSVTLLFFIHRLTLPKNATAVFLEHPKPLWLLCSPFKHIQAVIRKL